MQGWKTNVNGTQLWDMLQNSFAWAATTGYTNKANVTQRFPVIIGEFGTSFADIRVRATSAICTVAWQRVTFTSGYLGVNLECGAELLRPLHILVGECCMAAGQGCRRRQRRYVMAC